MAWSDAARRAAAEARKRNMVTVYHGTTAEAAKRILRQGLRVQPTHNFPKSRKLYKGDRAKSVYVTTDHVSADWYAQRLAIHRGVFGRQGFPTIANPKAAPAIVTLRVPKDMLVRDVESARAYTVAGKIPKKYVVGSKTYSMHYRKGMG